MSEFSEHQVVDAPGSPRSPGSSGAANGMNGANTGYANSVVAPSELAPHATEPPAELSALVDTWGSHLPALRLAAVNTNTSDDDSARDEAGPAALPPVPAHDLVAAPPHWLRPVRWLVGILLLALAWAATVAVFVLVNLLLGGFAQEPSLPVRIGLDVLTAIGVAWFAIVALAGVVAAAFSLGLAITARGW
jgi:hypothetical protein